MKRIIGLDMVRILAIMWVVIYHFNAQINPIPFAGNWGSYGVILFFILSGYLLRISYSKNPNLKNFYTKRFLSIFPLLWVTFIIFYVIHSIRINDFFFGGDPAKILISFAGFDAYLTSFGYTTYLVTGEWFTGAILILYLIFPLLYEMMEKNIYASSILVAILYFLSVYYDHSPITGDGKLFITIGSFWIGMTIEYIVERVKLRYWWLIPIIIIMVTIWIHPDWMLYIPGRTTAVACLFLVILILTKDIHLNPVVAKGLAWFSDISFAIYLVHHVVIYYFFGTHPDLVTLTSWTTYFKALIYTLVVITIIAAFLYWLSNCFIKLFSYAIKPKPKKEA